jgi:hypothetical protein
VEGTGGFPTKRTHLLSRGKVVDLTRKLGGSLRTAFFSEGNHHFLIPNALLARFLRSSRFIDQTTDGGSGNAVLLCHFRQAQTCEAVSHNSSPVDIKRGKPFDIEGRTKKILADKERKERQATAQAQIDHFVNSWSVNSTIPGRIDEVKSQAGRHFLANLKMGRGNVYDAELTLRVVQKLYHCETAEEMKATKDQAIDEINFGGLDEAARRRAEEAKHGAGLGNKPRYY